MWFFSADTTRVSYPHPVVPRTIVVALAEHAEREAERQHFLRIAAAVADSTPSRHPTETLTATPANADDDTLLALAIGVTRPRGRRAFLDRVDLVLREAAR